LRRSLVQICESHVRVSLDVRLDILKHPQKLSLRDFHGLYTQAPEMAPLLRRAVVEKRFRDDLRYRIRVVPLFLQNV
jgi:hypothetical protein